MVTAHISLFVVIWMTQVHDITCACCCTVACRSVAFPQHYYGLVVDYWGYAKCCCALLILCNISAALCTLVQLYKLKVLLSVLFTLTFMQIHNYATFLQLYSHPPLEIALQKEMTVFITEHKIQHSYWSYSNPVMLEAPDDGFSLISVSSGWTLGCRMERKTTHLLRLLTWRAGSSTSITAMTAVFFSQSFGESAASVLFRSPSARPCLRVL